MHHHHQEDGMKLGEWLTRQRQLYKKNKLDESRQNRLEAIDIGWDPFSDHWERNFVLLEQYKKQEGHCDVPKGHEEDGVGLGAWLHRQRKIRKGSKRGILGSDQIRRLDKLGMRWSFLNPKLGWRYRTLGTPSKRLKKRRF